MRCWLRLRLTEVEAARPALCGGLAVGQLRCLQVQSCEGRVKYPIRIETLSYKLVGGEPIANEESIESHSP